MVLLVLNGWVWASKYITHKLGENIWWLIVLAERSGIDVKMAIEHFLHKTEQLLK
ncbi:hypothetical protein Cpin_3793 [Chitinophaga pinensis DSM 2588]|uniref:Uncharacterized protein n=1 Tax=Chitinophaga pinensis (strain ATCC 43595 / DSM 2588 / LMG 13176 / NBRC 15968 / NCIMB 11800 / UQM 2034) TaxID=485918 RepID=A0A979G5T2_CHIPD|nr:hypothetical protein Cpin_3793 [Chitinophaga pinensis DSM 2588]